MANHDLPIGNVTNALRAMSEIEELLQQRGMTASETRFRISGVSSAISYEEATEWIRESSEEGYSDIRFVLERTDIGTVEVELAAATPSSPATQFHPE